MDSEKAFRYQKQVGTSFFLIWIKLSAMGTKSWKPLFLVCVLDVLNKYPHVKTESELFKSGSFVIGNS